MDASLENVGRKITAALLVTQSLFSAITIMVFTISSIIVVQLAGDTKQWMLGVPSLVTLLGAAAVAYPIGRFMNVAGRRRGLTVGHVLGICGALMAGWAVVSESLLFFITGILFIGLAKGVNDLGRYAAAEANVLHRRARALSLVVFGGTVGSITGPTLISSTGNLAESFGFPRFSGPFLAATAFFVLMMIVVNLFLRPDPLQIAQQLAETEPEAAVPVPQEGRSFSQIFWGDHRAKLAIAAMVFGQLTMVLVMTITPVHMTNHHHDIGPISWVIMAHTMGMFGLSFLVGWLVDRLGRIKMIAIGGVILIASCLLAPLSTGVLWLAMALFLLGLGWNCCFVAGSTLLTDILQPQEKSRVQGLVDTLINVASAIGGFGGGIVFWAIGFTITSQIGVVIALIPLTLVLFLRLTQSQLAVEGTTPAH
ncbi:MAG: MFS transporter [Anaerolineae bacterium]|nr:MFS transporter [Anaerolineae bacterium]MCB0179460.1 MFS transporter [Anaerolineae bacterium]MCB9102956.1 MFS transporter [Anaerolineales bacterium]